MAAAGKTVPDSTLPVLTVDELCELLRIHKSTLYRLIKTGKFPHFRVGTEYRFTRAAIDEWRRAQEAKPPAPSRRGPKPD